MTNLIKRACEKVSRKLQSFSNKITRQNTEWEGSTKYWQNRYLNGGNSGSGSYNNLAQFKAEVINKFVIDNKVNTVIEWGCGDGNQLLLAEYPHYIGLDVSNDAIKLCTGLFKNDVNKSFICIEEGDFVFVEKADLTLSLDVIFHLIEDDVYETYMRRLFASSNKFVCIYSCDDEDQHFAKHVRHRKFTDWIDKNVGDKWKLKSFVKNPYPYDPNNKNHTSWSDFYFYEFME